ncbi:hypothetical protein DRE_07638 [Drechslerella stenobrocha 248]|uniref:tRNA (uracil-O(2)-)-methyltransferase n=1 Tax=Drechslerella stenobrocha 248 TaxID=1043628 RepID=W7I3V8_9PEZI|nr:hypothetical protein DRE_07638 [Drechslerella stenobrocha 248]
MIGEPSDLSSIFRPSQGPVANRDGRSPSAASSSLSRYVWTRSCSTRIPHPTSSQPAQVVVNVILQPEYLSPIISRADVIFDSSLAGSKVGFAAEDAGFIGDFVAYSLSRRLVTKIIPRNPKRDPAVEQSVWVFESLPLSGDHNESANPSLLAVLVPHFSAHPSEWPFYLPNARAIAIQIDRSAASIHCLVPGDRASLPYNDLPVSSHNGGGDRTSKVGRNRAGVSASDIDPDRSQRMLNKLLEVLKKRFENPNYVKRVHHDTLIARERYQSVYQGLKAKHADRLCHIFASNGYEGIGCREVDKIFEELGIASFCICLWEQMYRKPKTPTGPSTSEAQTSHPFVGFVDLGCGSGVLTDVLLQEGWPGYGIDARSRRVWGSFDDDVQRRLVESILIPYVIGEGQVVETTTVAPELDFLSPSTGEHGAGSPFYHLPDSTHVYHSGRFPPGTFLICNHGDELTAWTPLLASLNQCNFLAIPCCSFNLAGKRFRAQHQHLCRDVRTREETKRSTYQSLVAYVESLCNEVGVIPEKEWLRIPSTRNLAIVGREYHGGGGNSSKDGDGVASREPLIREVIRREGGAEGWMAMVTALREQRQPNGLGGGRRYIRPVTSRLARNSATDSDSTIHGSYSTCLVDAEFAYTSSLIHSRMAQRYLNPSRLSDRSRQHGQSQAQAQATYFTNPPDFRAAGRTQLFIENIPAVVDEPKLRKRFEVFGSLENVCIIASSEPRLGICNYTYNNDAFAAFQGMNRALFEGNTLRIILASPTDTYEEARSTLASETPFSGRDIDSALPNNDSQRMQMCDHQDTITGHVCGEGFIHSQGLTRHWWNHTWNYRPWKCERDSACVYSKRGFTTEAERDRHQSNAHVTAGDTRPYKCPVPSCHYHKKGFETQNAQSMHESVHLLDFEEHGWPHFSPTFESSRSEETKQVEDIHAVIDSTSTAYGNHGRDLRHPPHGSQNSKRPSSNTRHQRPPAFRPNEKKSEPTDYNGGATVDYRPFKCQVRGCKFVKEGFETQSELISHEDREHDGQRSDLTTSIIPDISPAETAHRPTTPLLKQLLSNSEQSNTRLPSPEFLQCNNVECSEAFASEDNWREHSMACKTQRASKQCSFTDCQGKFDSLGALSSHEFESHGIRICSSLSCNRAFHQLEDAEAHMRDLHSNPQNAGRRPRLAFIASVPSWNEEIGETGFPYDPYRCALLNISHQKPALKSSLSEHKRSQKGKEIARGEATYMRQSLPNKDLLDQSLVRQRTEDSKPNSETLPRYSVIFHDSSSSPLSFGAAITQKRPMTDAQPEPLAAIPAEKPETPLLDHPRFGAPVKPSPSNTNETKPEPNSRNPLYRYNTDGSRYVTGAVVLSPDKHQVLVLRSKDESKGVVYQLPSGFLELNDQNMEASSLRECWQNAGVVGRILRAIEPAPAEEPDENGLADWHSYFEVEVEKEKELWPEHRMWYRRWLSYREARVVLSSQPDAIRALERSTIFKRGSSRSGLGTEAAPDNRISSHSTHMPLKPARLTETRPRRRKLPDERPPATRKYNTISPATDNITTWRREILPWLRRNFSSVMGKNKHGAIELLRVRNRPTICITCSDPKELVLDTFAEVVSGLFPMHVKVGLLARSSRLGGTSPAGNQACEHPGEDRLDEDANMYEVASRHPPTAENLLSDDPTSPDLKSGNPLPQKGDVATDTKTEKAFRPPPVFGKYINRPSCGATIGTVRDDEGYISAGTFGGVVILVKQDGTETPYGLISHHVIEEKTEDTELGIGVDEGWLKDSSDRQHQYPVQQPARMDLEESKDSLDMQRFYCDREKRYCDVDDGKAVRAKLAMLDGLDRPAVDFGHVVYSSGYGFDANRHQMDWALIGDIPPWRLKDNIVPGVDTFYDLHYDGCPKAPYPVEKSFFNFLSETFEQEHSIDLSEIDPLRRIHGVGSYSGIMDGIVSSETAFFRLDGMDSEEWFFTPRYNGGLGVKGDSGTWIFDDFGKVVGQIIAYNYRTDTAYFTRMDYLFEHIKSKTKAVEVYIPYKGELSKWKTDDTPKQLEIAQAGSVTDASSSYVGSAFGTVTTGDTDITSPLSISDSGLGWAGFTKQS